MYTKYIKYKSKYLNLKGGALNDLPLLIYTIGQEESTNQRSYICTLLHQIKLFKKLAGITNFRVFVIYGNNVTTIHTCEHARAAEMNNEPIPYGVNIYYINPEDTIYTVLDIYKSILNKHTNPNTPVIYIYDGHGYTDRGDNNGNMVLNNSVILNDEQFNYIFKKISGNKLFLFTQCGSYDFQQRLETKYYKYKLDKSDKLNNYTSICSTKKPNDKGIGARILVAISRLLNISPSIYYNFIDMSSDLEHYYIYSDTPMPISSIMVKYIPAAALALAPAAPAALAPAAPAALAPAALAPAAPAAALALAPAPLFKTNDEVLLYIQNQDIYCDSDIDKRRLSLESSKDKKKWKLEHIRDNIYYIKTIDTYKYFNPATKVETINHGFLDIYNEAPGAFLSIWNPPLNDNHKFIINDDLTLSPFKFPSQYIIYTGSFYIRSSLTTTPLTYKLRIKSAV